MSKEEIWKDVKGYEGLYEVSNFGRVKSKDRRVKVVYKSTFYKNLKGKILKPTNTIGYDKVALYKEGRQKYHNIHRLVAEAFIPNENNLPIVNHKDESRNNNHVDNLEWCTHKYNITYGTAPDRKNKKLSKPVFGIHVETGEKITFPSMMEAGRNGFVQSAISLCCNGKKEEHKNYKWKFKTERGD